MENRSIGQIFMFFNCTMARDIPKMGKILKLNILEILDHPKGVLGFMNLKSQISSVVLPAQLVFILDHIVFT